MGTVVSSSPAFETEFVFDYKGTNNWFVQGFCTGDAPTWINPSETSNIVTFNLTGRVQVRFDEKRRTSGAKSQQKQHTANSHN